VPEFKVLLSPDIPENEIWASSHAYESLKDRVTPEFEEVLKAVRETQALADKLYAGTDRTVRISLEVTHADGH
jgi:hypothetical protein